MNYSKICIKTNYTASLVQKEGGVTFFPCRFFCSVYLFLCNLCILKYGTFVGKEVILKFGKKKKRYKYYPQQKKKRDEMSLLTIDNGTNLMT